MDHQVFAQLLGNYGEFVGAIAVVATLAYLAVQVRQSKHALDANTRALDETRNLTRAEAVYNLTRRWDEVTKNAMGSKETASIFVRGNQDVSQLDEVEQTIYANLLVPFLSHQLAAQQMARDGFLGLGDEITEIVDELIGDMLRRNPGARAWWERVQWSYPHREQVNATIAKHADPNRFGIGEVIVPPTAPEQ
jgi:hypothetical protein